MNKLVGSRGRSGHAYQMLVLGMCVQGAEMGTPLSGCIYMGKCGPRSSVYMCMSLLVIMFRWISTPARYVRACGQESVFR